MALYTKRVGQLDLFAEGLLDAEGEKVPSIKVETATIQAGDRSITVKVVKGTIEIVASHKAGYGKETVLFRTIL